MPDGKIMIVEDEIILAMNIEITLKNMGYTVTGISCSGEDSLAMAENDLPDAVLMDIKLNGPLDGIEAAAIIKERFNIPVIFTTGNTDDKTKERAMSIEPAAYLNKPVVEGEMVKAIEGALNRI